MKNFGHIGNEFINLYSKENPILKQGEVCYFLFANTIDYHRQILAKGVIIVDKFSDGMNKQYFIKMTEFIETPKIISEFIYGKTLLLNPIGEDEEIISARKPTVITQRFDFTKIVFKVDAFFVRNTQEKAIELRKEYTEHIRKDIVKQLQEVDEILQS